MTKTNIKNKFHLHIFVVLEQFNQIIFHLKPLFGHVKIKGDLYIYIFFGMYIIAAIITITFMFGV